MRGEEDSAPTAGRLSARGPRSLVLRIVVTFLVLSALMVGVVAAVAYARAREELQAFQPSRLSSVQVLTVDALQRWLDEQRRNVVFAARLLGGVERQGTLPEVRGSVAVAEGRSSTTVAPLGETSLGGGPTVVVTTPLYDDSGRARATLAANLDVRRLDQVVLARTGLGGGGRTYLVSEGREVFARGPEGRVSSPAIERALAGFDGEASYDDYTGTPVIGSWTWVPSIGAALVSEVPQSAAFAPARALARWIAVIGAAVVAALAALTLLAARRIARPILAITDAAQGVRAGDLERVAPVTTRDEVGGLSIAFNDMTDRLRRDVIELENRVAERTLELSTQKRYFETLVEISPAAIVTMDSDLRVTGCNPAAEHLFGYQAEEAVGRPVDDLVLTSDAMRREGQDVAAEALEQADFAAAISVSGEGLLAVINDVLHLSKIEAGRMELDLAEIDPAEVVEEAVELLASAADWQTDIVLDISGSVPPRVVADGIRLRQIVLSLVGNAVKFTNGGRVVVAVHGDRIRPGAAGSKVMLIVAVTDTGIGITPERQERLFDRFVQATSQTQRRYGGTGLGLAISRRLAELMGGTLELTSPVANGAGSRFELAVPVDVVAESRGLRHPGLTNRRLTVVHHDPVVADVLAERLREAGAQVRTDRQVHAESWSGSSGAVLDAAMPATYAALSHGEPSHVVLVSQVPRWRAPEVLGWVPPASVPWLTEPVRTRSLVRSVMTALGVSVADADAAGTEAAAAQLPPLRVLVAEDNLVNQKRVRAMLARLGITPDIVDDGAAAVAAIRETTYDVALLDLRMPVMDGIEAARAIVTGAPHGTPVPVLVALTADVGETDRRAARQAGMTDFLAKPLRPEELYPVLARVPYRSGSLPMAALPSFERLRSMAGDDEDLARELAEPFVQGVPALVAEMDDAVGRDSASDLRRVAHTLKSHGALLGDPLLEQQAREVEDLLLDGRLDEALAAATQLRGTAVDTAARWSEVV